MRGMRLLGRGAGGDHPRAAGIAGRRPQSWQPDTSRDDLAQHCAALSGAQQAFFLVSIFIAFPLA
jgi:hypothetical protein